MKKSKEYPFFFILYGITYLALIVFCGHVITRTFELSLPWQIAVVSAGIAVCALLLFWICRSAGMRYTVRKKRDQYIRKQYSYLITDMLPVVVIYVVAILSGILWINMNSLTITGNTELFENACVAQNVYADARFSYHGLTWLYMELLHGFCLLLGNDVIAVCGLNLVIRVFTVFAGYLFLYYFLNRKAAIAFAVLYHVLPFFYDALLLCDPSVLYVLLIFVYMAVLVMLNRHAQWKQSRFLYVRYVFTGILAGILLFCDLYSVVLMLVGTTMIMLSDTEYREKKKFRLIWFLAGWLIGVGGAAVIGTVITMNEHSMQDEIKALYDYLTKYVDLYIQKAEIFKFSEDVYAWNLWLVIIVTISGLPLVLQPKNGKEVLSGITPLYFGITLMLMLHIFQTDVYMMVSSVALLCISAGFGMMFEMKHPLLEQKRNIEKTMISNEDGTTQEIRLIENPLPLPKKHVRKELDYQYEVDVERMYYDVMVPDSDDFDLK